VLNHLLGFLRLCGQALRLFRAAGYRTSSYSVCHSSLESLGNANNRSVAQSSLGLLDTVVSRHAAVLDLLSSQVRHSQLEDPEDVLEQRCDEQTKVFGDGPHLTGRGCVAALLPCSTGKVPEVHGRVVCDEEGLAVHLLVAQGSNLSLLFTLVRRQESRCGQVVGVCDVGGLSEVEEVGVVTKLELGLTLVVCSEHRRKKSLVADTKDSRGTESAGEEARVGSGTVVFENRLFGKGLQQRLVLAE
jgi:hypothetical protein